MILRRVRRTRTSGPSHAHVRRNGSHFNVHIKTTTTPDQAAARRGLPPSRPAAGSHPPRRSEGEAKGRKAAAGAAQPRKGPRRGDRHRGGGGREGQGRHARKTTGNQCQRVGLTATWADSDCRCQTCVSRPSSRTAAGTGSRHRPGPGRGPGLVGAGGAPTCRLPGRGGRRPDLPACGRDPEG
jgi:hypothetical protein